MAQPNLYHKDTPLNPGSCSIVPRMNVNVCVSYENINVAGSQMGGLLKYSRADFVESPFFAY